MSLLRTIKESRLMRPCKRGLNKLGFHLTQISASERGRRLDKFTQDVCGFGRWFGQSVRELLRLRRRPDRRLLAVYDLSTQPFSIGDILVIQEASLVVREQYKLGMIDFALLYDAACPTCADPAFSTINSENLLFHLASVLPAAQVNPHHGSLFVFNSPIQLTRFIADNADRYHIWPSAWRFALREYNYHHVFNELLHNYHLKHGTLPRLACRQHLADWAYRFYGEHVGPGIPVTVQVRNNKTICTERNLNIERWLEFFGRCEAIYPARFVVIGTPGEIDQRLRGRPNVVIAKDHGTAIEQDLALIQTAAIHMGASSGPGTLAVFNQRPYLFVNSNAHLVGHDDMVRDGALWKFTFATPYQRFAEPPETTELLLTEFARMWATVNLPEWQQTYAAAPTTAFESWLR